LRGRDAETWIAHDVPACIREQFPSQGPTFISGLSMGGYGALRIGFKYPERFRGISAHSSITESDQMRDFVRELDLTGIPAQERDILQWARLNHGQLPPVRFDCGQEDPLFEANRRLHKELLSLGIANTFEAFPGGHDWSYWREHISSTLRFFDALL
jgi:S-formylglutathione hydrolase FrmB